MRGWGPLKGIIRYGRGTMLICLLQELYEMAQRKLLRQLVSYTDQDDPYPRLFVADLNYDPDSNNDPKVRQDALITSDLSLADNSMYRASI